MATPDPRQGFRIASICGRTDTQSQSDQSAKKSFFDDLKANTSALSDIEAFQGPVADGLRSLVGVSDAIRSGDADSAIIKNGVSADQGGEAGANIVLANVGINPNKAVQAAAFNPGVVNRGTAEAQSVYDRVKQGNFELNDIPGSFQSLQNLATLTGGIFNEGDKPAAVAELCGAIPYATALIRYAPKYKFLFIVQFTFKPEYAARLNDKNQVDKMAFVVKNSGRPNINIEHEEVNVYNFHTRVAKRTSYEPITMRFIDDQKSNSHNFLNHYIRAISPISNLKSAVDGGVAINNYQSFEENGMSSSGNKSASLTSLDGDVTSMFDEVRVYHMFDNGKQMTVYSYANPKISSINFDDLDMADNGNGNEIEIQFAYDRLYMLDNFSVRDNQDTIESLSGGGIGQSQLQIRPVFGATDSSEEGGNEAEYTDPKGEGGPEVIEVGSVSKENYLGDPFPPGTVTTTTPSPDGSSLTSTYIP